MQEILNKYFWDGNANLSNKFIIKRIIEYASFPDMIKLSFMMVRDNIDLIDLNMLRTSSKRIEFIKKLKPFMVDSITWEEAIVKMLNAGYFKGTFPPI